MPTLNHLKTSKIFKRKLNECKFEKKHFGSIHDWGTKNKCLTKKGLHRTTLNFFLSYIIIIVMDCCMPLDKMMSF